MMLLILFRWNPFLRSMYLLFNVHYHVFQSQYPIVNYLLLMFQYQLFSGRS